MRELREKRNMSRAKLVKRSGEDGGAIIAEITIERMETKQGARFHPENVATVARVLGCPQTLLTTEAEDITTLFCTKVSEGREVYELAKGSDDLLVEIIVEPSKPEVQQAALVLVENVEKVVRKEAPQTTADILRAQFEMREAIDTLADAGLWVYFGQLYRLLGYRSADGETCWDQEYDGSNDHPREIDGVSFCNTLMIALTDQDQVSIPVEANTNPNNIEINDEHIFINSLRVADGKPPLSKIEFEKEYYGIDREQEAKEAWEDEQYAQHQYEEMERHHQEQMQIQEDEEFARRLDEEAGITVEAPPMNEAEKKKLADRRQAHKEKMDAMSDAEKREHEAKVKALNAEIEARFQAYKAKMEAKRAGEAS